MKRPTTTTRIKTSKGTAIVRSRTLRDGRVTVSVRATGDLDLRDVFGTGRPKKST